jgi:hypothetical protein
LAFLILAGLSGLTGAAIVAAEVLQALILGLVFAWIVVALQRSQL